MTEGVEQCGRSCGLDRGSFVAAHGVSGCVGHADRIARRPQRRVGAYADPGVTAADTQLLPTVLAQIPHDPSAFTEGIEIGGANLYESTGLWGHSQLRELDPATGALRRSVSLPPDYFGEGIAIVGDRIWQLTYRNGIAIEWDKDTLTVIREVPMSGEGWGLCSDGRRLVQSDGTCRLRFRNAADFVETGSVTVITRTGEQLNGLNGLACVDGQVWANIFPTDQIVRIDLATGLVTAVVDASGLLPGPRTQGQVLNGIAHVDGQIFLLAAKWWPFMFRVRFDPAP
ncbi:glutaminyl-peptide cyclotransferase [Mycobacterium heidelbergense]|uniref:glutaminyl-peptide cyclotransferase n=1 Tax=Mycobacterium heidelbergense TaxID=53376 RepID=UPI003CF1F7E6